MNRAAKDVDAYIKAAPKEAQGKLAQLRKIIRSAAPKAEERISYSMPYYHYHGRLLYFAAQRNHIGFYILPPIVEQHRDELTGYETTKGTIRLPLDEPLPTALIRKLVKARVRHMEGVRKKG